MAESNSVIVERMKHRRALFQEDLPVRLAALDAAWEEVRRPTRRGPGLGELVRLAHNLAGTAGVFGFSQLGEQAGRLEQAADLLLASSQTLTPRDEADIRGALALLKALATVRPNDPPGPSHVQVVAPNPGEGSSSE